jgi:hypothetical protein
MQTTYEKLTTDDCEKGGKHQVFIGTTAGDPAPAWCIKCQATALEVPDDVWDNF